MTGCPIRHRLVALALLLLLAGCGAPEAAPLPTAAPAVTSAPLATATTTSPPPAAISTPLPAVTPTADASPTAAPAPADWGSTASVEGDYYVLGNPAAPIRLIDYSDFL